jgi:hypothetical protein
LESLVNFGIPKKIERLVKMTLEGAQAKVIMDGKISTPFGISIGVRQGDGLSATLFNLVLHKALKNLEQSNMILNRLTQICGYANDIMVTARSFPALEALYVELSREAGRVGLVVSPCLVLVSIVVCLLNCSHFVKFIYEDLSVLWQPPR